MADKNNRFVKVYCQKPKFIGEYLTIYVDRETGINYLFTQGGNAGGLTPLLNADGTPVITYIPDDYGE